METGTFCSKHGARECLWCRQTEVGNHLAANYLRKDDKMTDFKHIKALGLEVIEKEEWTGAESMNPSKMWTMYVRASDLEKILADGVRLYGSNQKRYWDDHEQNCPHQSPVNIEFEDHFPKTHTGILLGIQPIEQPKPVTKEELAKAIELDVVYSANAQVRVIEILKRIQKYGVKS